jgi:hypothetical protein
VTFTKKLYRAVLRRAGVCFDAATEVRRARTAVRGKRKAGPLWEGGRYKGGARLDD